MGSHGAFFSREGQSEAKGEQHLEALTVAYVGDALMNDVAVHGLESKLGTT
jgi:hypothetical protein